jgi:hypothetical protein
MKEHIQKENRLNSPAHYEFSYWIYNAKDKSENEIYKKYCHSPTQPQLELELD